jgi:hypothetical protein
VLKIGKQSFSMIGVLAGGLGRWCLSKGGDTVKDLASLTRQVLPVPCYDHDVTPL